jgi:serpin B
MMSLSGEKARFNYAETENLQMLELPYDGEELSMLILLPKGDGLKSLEDSLDAERLAALKSGMTHEQVDVHLPKFKFETKYFMADTLKQMGMPTAFSGDADFSGMTGKKDLFISEVIHQAFVEVNEEGTEAAAATAVIMKLTAVSPESAKTFRADHPFIFLIQEKSTGNILFMGRVSDPTK